jgi:hypothetical protein
MDVIRSRGDSSNRESYLGSDCSGVTGTTNRVLTLANIALSKNELISVAGVVMTPDIDYTINHLNSATTITFIGIIQDAQQIEVLYFTKE